MSSDLELSRSQLEPLTRAGRTSRRRFGYLVLIALFALVLIAGSRGQAMAAGNDPGAVFVMTNDPSGNAVLAFERSVDGTLTPADSYATGGLGSGAGLGSQGSLVLSRNQRWLLVVNAGSNDISVFKVQQDRLKLAAVSPSGGTLPISLTINRNLVYVLNNGGSGNIAGFTMAADGSLSALPGAKQPLSNGGSGAAPGPAQISFSPDGRQLVVTEKASNLIVTYQVGADGLASPPVAYPSAGTTPFGFSFTQRRQLLVSEAFGGAADASAASSYSVSNGVVQVISPSIPTNQTAACWLVVTQNGKFAYTTNAGSGSISGFHVEADGTLSLLNADGRTGDTGPGSAPLDAALSGDSHYLYVLARGARAIAVFEVAADGSLASLGQVAIPVGAIGIAAR